MKTTHLTDEKKELYLKYIMNEEENEQKIEKDLEEEILKIEEHVYECDKCAQELHEQYKLVKYLNNWNVQKDNKTVDQMRIISALRKQKAEESDEKVGQLIDDWIANVGNLQSSALKLYLKAKRAGKRLLSQITFETTGFLQNRFQYATIAQKSRGEETEKNITNFTKVIISPRIEDKIEVSIIEKENRIIIDLLLQDTEKIPHIALIPINGEKTENPKIYIKKPQYSEEEKRYKCDFSNLEKGEYFLLFE